MEYWMRDAVGFAARRYGRPVRGAGGFGGVGGDPGDGGDQGDFGGPGRGFGPGRGRGRGGRFRPRAAARTTAEQRQQIQAWVAGRVPADWAVEAAEVLVDDDEVLVVVHLPKVALGEGAGDAEQATAAGARITAFREETRQHRMEIAEEAQPAFGRVLSWGAACGAVTQRFTTASVPVMTRLWIDERHVLDTLVDAGVARSRSEALAWCVRLVGRNEDAWLHDLRTAFEQVEEVRSRGPAGA